MAYVRSFDEGISAITDFFTELQETVAEKESEISVLEYKVTTLEGELNEEADRVSAALEELEEKNTYISQLEDRVRELEYIRADS